MLAFTSLALVGIMMTVSPARAQQTKNIVDPFTVFAPTDEACAKLPPGTLDNLLKPEKKAMLRRVLTYHVVAGTLMAADILTVNSITADSGDMLSIKVGGGTVMAGKTRVVKTDIVASNGYWYGVLPLHALVFRGLLRQIARRAVQVTAPAQLATFSYGSIIGAPAAEVFRWHEQPGALAALTPTALVRIEQQEGRHPRRRARHAVDRHRSGTRPLGGAAPRLHRRPAIL